MFKNSIILLSLLAITCMAHGVIKVPQRRVLGPAMLASCGAGPYNNIKADPYGPIENAVAKKGSDTKADCDLYFCKGYKYEDNGANIYSYTAGQVVNMQTDIVAHHRGYCNVSILSTTTKKVIAGPLISWPFWGMQYPYPPEESNFNITIPNLGTQCKEAGKCVIQWYWYSPRNDPLYPGGNNQTYESCIDFTA
ncbi:hypothetical protein FRC03_012263 [Tulasnella sp. 419]|nr:hypothetical protein FRC03_012263 [Tulasnella sp. 419]